MEILLVFLLTLPASPVARGRGPGPVGRRPRVRTALSPLAGGYLGSTISGSMPRRPYLSGLPGLSGQLCFGGGLAGGGPGGTHFGGLGLLT